MRFAWCPDSFALLPRKAVESIVQTSFGAGAALATHAFFRIARTRCGRQCDASGLVQAQLLCLHPGPERFREEAIWSNQVPITLAPPRDQPPQGPQTMV